MAHPLPLPRRLQRSIALAQDPMSSLPDWPGIVLAGTVCAYWSYVGVMSVRVRRRTRKMAGIVPSQPLEKAMWLV
jgi:hypothetical protein